MRITAWLFAVLLSLLGGVAGAETLSYTTYYHNDHLGSPVAATNAQGALLWRAHFRPYGERQEDPQSANYGSVGYTGHVQDADSGMVYAGARYYDPLIGRFMAIDPAPVAASAPGSFNRYLYANNNPYAYTDPDGELPFLVIAAVAFGGMMIHSDMANAPAVGETPQQLGTMDHLGALPGLNAGKAVTTLKAAGEVKDAVKVAKSGLGGNPFKGKSFDEIDKLLTERGFKKVGADPASGKGSYFHPESGRKYYLDKGGNYREGTELPHVDVHRMRDGVNLEKEGKRRYPLGDNLIEPKP